MKFLIEHNLLEINDEETIAELKCFQKNLKAFGGYSDGLVTSIFAGLLFMLFKKNKIEAMFGSEEDGVFIKTGKNCL